MPLKNFKLCGNSTHLHEYSIRLKILQLTRRKYIQLCPHIARYYKIFFLWERGGQDFCVKKQYALRNVLAPPTMVIFCEQLLRMKAWLQVYLVHLD